MKEFHTTPSNKKYGIDNLPPEEMRLHDEEIKSAVEYDRETLSHDKKKNLSVVKEEDEFAFENSRESKETKNTKGSSSNNDGSSRISDEKMTSD